jgi:hypothetical protein
MSRTAVHANVWPTIEAELHRPASIPAGLVLATAAAFLVAWRTLEAATIDPLAPWTRLVTVGIVVLVFLCLRVNPFRVEPRLV